MLDNKMAPETWNQWFNRILDGDEKPEFTQYEQMIRLVENMAQYGIYGAKKHVSSIWVLHLSKQILKQIEMSEKLAPGAIKNIAKAGFQALRGLYTVYQWMQAPMNAALALTNRARDSDDEPLVKPRSKKMPAPPSSDSDNEPLVKQRAAPSSDSDNKPLAQTNPKRNPVDTHRNTPGRVKISKKTDIQTHLARQSGSGMPAMTPALVNYAPGIRQSKRGGGNTIRAMAPILEFNETADDPYLMRQQVH